MSYASTDYNIGINMSCKKDLDIEKLSKLLSGIEGAEDYLVGAGYYFDVDKPEYTKEYGEYCGQLLHKYFRIPIITTFGPAPCSFMQTSPGHSG